MTEDEAEVLGRQAFHNGQHQSPLADPAMFAELEHAQVGEKTHLMTAFGRGWNAEQAKATAELLQQLRDEDERRGQA